MIQQIQPRILTQIALFTMLFGPKLPNALQPLSVIGIMTTLHWNSSIEINRVFWLRKIWWADRDFYRIGEAVWRWPLRKPNRHLAFAWERCFFIPRNLLNADLKESIWKEWTWGECKGVYTMHDSCLPCQSIVYQIFFESVSTIFHFIKAHKNPGHIF